MEILYFVSNFNIIPESFVLREIRELQRQGVIVKVVDINPLTKTDDYIIDKEMVQFVPKRWINLLLNSIHACITGKSVWNDSLMWKSGKSVIASKGLFKFLMSGLVIDSLVGKYDKYKDIHIHVHHLFLTSFTAFMVSNKIGCPFSITVHTSSGVMSEYTLKKVLNRAAFIRTISVEVQTFFNRIISNPSKFHLIRNGIDLNEVRFHPIRLLGNEIQLISIGDLRDKKGFDLGIEACRLLSLSDIPFNYTIVGRGPEEGYLRKLVDRYDLKDKIRFAGGLSIENTLKELQGKNILLVPSREPFKSTRDGLPTVIIEAMSMGVPVIAANFGGINDAIQHNKTGMLFQEGDFKTLSSHIIKLWADNDLREEIVKNALEKVKTDFNIKINVNKIKSLYDSSWL